MSTFHLNLSLLHPGHFRSAWRLKGADPLSWIDVTRLAALTRRAEEARIHAVFLGDSPGLGESIRSHPEAGLEPTVLFAHLLSGTEHIGAIATSSSTYSAPYELARRYLALDHVTGGRAAFNLVTTYSPAAAGAFGLEAPPEKSDRYARAEEFAGAVLSLWDGWDDDAIVADPESGEFVSADRLHHTDFAGDHLSVHSALSVPPSPQRRPVLVQAGGSEGGIRLGTRYADVIFTAGQVLDEAVSFRAHVKNRAEAQGRDPSQLLTTLGVIVLIGSTEDEVRARITDLLATESAEADAARVVSQLGLEPGSVTAETLITTRTIDEAPHPPASHGFRRAVRALIDERPRTVRELVLSSGGGSGHRLLAGTPAQIADDLITWHAAGAADGFTIMAADSTVDIDRFLDEVVPLLQERGAFQREYAGETLRENLGLNPLTVGSHRRTHAPVHS